MERNHIAALFLGMTILAVALVGAMAVSGAVGAESPEESSENERISVDATGEAEAEPDKAIVNVAVRAEGDEPGAIRDELARDAATLEDQLDEEDVDYKTSSYQVREPRRDDPDDPDYVGIHAFEITVEDPDNVGNIVEVAADAGAEIGNIDMTLAEETRDDLRDEAIENAMDDARNQAETIAAAGDLMVTGVVSVDASQRSYNPVSYDVPVAEDDAAEPAPPTDIDMGDVSVSYSVEVTFDASS